MIRSPRLAGAGLLLAVLAACDQNGGPLSSDVRTSVPENIVALDCKVSVKPAASFGCAPAAPSTGANPVLTVGNQNVYVRLAASNLVFDAGTGIFSFDATVQNLLAQALGTTNGTTLDTNGVQVFFHSGPTSTGAGSVSVLNATGTGDFTGTEQPYYQYDAILAKDVVSSPKSWQFQVAGGATDFVFKVYVRAAVQYPEGYVTLSQRGDTLGTADTVRITHVVNNAVNTPLADQAVTWSSSNTGVATVDGSGLITAVAPGSAIISAVQGARTGQMTVRVCTSLAVGAVYTTGMPGASSLCLAGGAEYTYMPVNLSTSSALSLALTATGVGSVTGPPSPSIAAGQGSGLNLEAPRPNDDLHIAMMERDLRDVAGVLRNPAARVNRSGGSGTLRRNVVQGVPAVGDLMSLNTTSGCSGTRNDRTGKVMSVGQHVVIVADTMNPANGFTAAQYDSIALEFDTLVYPTDSTAFGTPADIDRNGRVVAFYTRAVNELTPPGSSSFVAGYFSARDLFSSAVGSCTLSNEGEMFYMLVPDPTGVVNGNARTVASMRTGSASSVGTIAHEFQHLINASRRVYVSGIQSFETVWLNEGLSHIAEELMFYRASGMVPRSNVGPGSNAVSGIQASSKRVNAYNTYASANIGRLRTWIMRPDTSGPIKGNDVLATRGSVWAFLRYAADRINGDDSSLWYALANSKQSGTTNLQAALGTDPVPWVRDWGTAMYADDAGIGAASMYTITSWNFRAWYTLLGGSTAPFYPLQVRALTSGSPLTLSYSAGGGTAYVRFSVPANTFGFVTALSGGAIPTSPFALSVIRTK